MMSEIRTAIQLYKAKYLFQEDNKTGALVYVRFNSTPTTEQAECFASSKGSNAATGDRTNREFGPAIALTAANNGAGLSADDIRAQAKALSLRALCAQLGG